MILAESSGLIIGSVVAAWDGWRGTVYRLAVAPSHRRSGLGRQLVRAAEHRLVEQGATRLQATVIGSDLQAFGFWENTDWAHAAGQTRFTRG